MQHPEIDIEGRKIGYEHEPLIIVEIGINHGGSLEEAFKLVDAAKAAGAELIKHQTHIPQYEMSSHAKHVIPEHDPRSIFDIMEACSLTEAEEIALKRYVERNNMIFLSSPFSKEAVDRLVKMDINAFKIGSGECNNTPLLKYIAELKKPVILSTGMNHLHDIEKSVHLLENAKVPYALLHTTNVYPTPFEAVRLGAMTQLMEYFPSAVVGLSDHTTTNHACLGAVALGASILERHFTDSKERIGPDISCSMTPDELKSLLKDTKILKTVRGGRKEPHELESNTSEFAFASVVTTKKISSGEIFSNENIWVKRPGDGDFSASQYERLLGKKASRDIEADNQLTKNDVLAYES